MSGTLPIPSLPVASGTATTDLFLVSQVSGAITPQLNMTRPLLAQGILQDVATGAAGQPILPAPVFTGLPTTPPASGSGIVWNNGGVLCIA